MRTPRVLGVAAALAVGSSTAAFATDFGTICGGTAFATCASVEISDLGGGKFELDIGSIAGDPGVNTFSSTFTTIAFANLPGNMVITGLFSETGDGDWDYCENDGGGGDPNCNDINGNVPYNQYNGTYTGATPEPPPVDNGLSAGESTKFVFTYTGTFGVTGAVLGIHGQQGPDDCSTKLYITFNGGTSANQPGDDGECDGETVIPEPITMTLLGTGLVGMGGMNLLRRRRKDEELV